MALSTATLRRATDYLSEAVLYAMIIFSPWAFGSTQTWSVQCMNTAGYVSGVLWLARVLLRRHSNSEAPATERLRGASHRVFTRLLATLTVLILAYTFLSAWNARLKFEGSGGIRLATYLESISWLPSSYDQAYTWAAFQIYLALACVFWSTRDWLLNGGPRSHPEALSADRSERAFDRLDHPPSELPPHWRRLLWLLCLNGGILALEGILQRMSGTSKLLWMVTPHINSMAEAQFGPYAYRSNAATYFNLLWPLCIAFWWIQRAPPTRGRFRARRVGGSAHTILLPLAVLMAAAPVISISRGGTLICGILILGMLAMIWVGERSGSWARKLGMTAIVGAAVGLSFTLAWRPLADRFRSVFDESMSGRAEIYANTRPIAEDFKWFGTGPGSFAGVYNYYRTDKRMVWQAYGHDDWLETRVTFGRVGMALVLGALALVPLIAASSSSVAVPRGLAGALGLSMFGFLLHAKYDFPLQVHSLLFLFVVECALFSSMGLTRRRPAR